MQDELSGSAAARSGQAPGRGGAVGTSAAGVSTAPSAPTGASAVEGAPARAPATGETPPPVRRSRILYFSLLNVIACMGVVLLHTNGTFWEGPAAPGWTSANFIETFLYWPVPVFFMISGALLIDYRQRMGTAEYLRRRFVRTVVPFLFWSLVALVYAWWESRAHGGPFGPGKRAVIDSLVNTEFIPVYWFFPVLFGLYLSYPLLSAVRDQDKRRVFSYLAACALVFVSALPLVFSLLRLRYNPSYTPVVAGGYMVYPLLGWLLAREELTGKQRAAVYALGVAGFAAQLLGTYFLSGHQGPVDPTFKGYTNLPAILQACAVFVLAKQAEPTLQRLASSRPAAIRLLNTAASLTFGVYLVHYYLVLQLPRALGVDPHLLAWRLGGALLIFLLSAGAVWVMRKVPVLRRIVP